MLENKSLGFIGSGIMAEAIILGLLKEELVAPSAICCADPYPARGKELEKTYGVRSTTNNLEAVTGADIVVLSVKPQVLPDIAPGLLGKFSPNQLILSILSMQYFFSFCSL